MISHRQKITFFAFVLAFVISSGFWVVKTFALQQKSYLAKSPGDSTVYLVTDQNQKHPFSSADIFLSYGYKWSEIKNVTEEFLNSLAPVQYIKLANHPQVDLLDGQVRRYLSAEAAEIFLLNEQQILVVNESEWNSYATGSPMIPDSEKVSNCQISSDSSSLAQCEFYNALNSNNYLECFKISDEKLAGACVSTFDSSETNPLEFCKEFSSQTSFDECAERVAFKKRNEQICENISKAEQVLSCKNKIAVISGNTQACEKNADKNYCLYSVAILANRQEACQLIESGSEYFEPCKNFFNTLINLNSENDAN